MYRNTQARLITTIFNVLLRSINMAGLRPRSFKRCTVVIPLHLDDVRFLRVVCQGLNQGLFSDRHDHRPKPIHLPCPI